MTEDAEYVEDFLEFYNKPYGPDIEQFASEYPKDRRVLTLDHNTIFQFSDNLALDLVSDPDGVLEDAEQALREYDLPIEVDWKYATVAVHNVSQQPTVSNLRSDHVNEAVTIKGTAVNVTEVRPKLETAVYICERCGSENPVPQTNHGLQEPYQCTGCDRDGPYNIDYDKSDMIDSQYAKVQEDREELSSGEAPEDIKVTLEGDMTGVLTAGDDTIITGIYRPDRSSEGGDSPTVDTYLEGLYVERKGERFEDIEITDEDKEKIRELSNDPNLYEKLVGSMAPSIFGYKTEKLAIILQLFSGVTKHLPDGSRVRGDFHMLLIGDPGTAKSALIQYVKDIAPRAVYTSGKNASSAGLTATATRDEMGDGDQWTLKAGALVLADQGIAAVDELDKMNSNDRSALHEALEQQQTSVSKAGITATMKTRCSLLAAANPKYGRFDNYESIGDQIDLEPPLMSRFDLIFVIKDQPDPEQDRELAEMILDSNYAGEVNTQEITEGVNVEHEDENIDEILGSVDPEIETELLQKYIAYAKQNVMPSMTKEARKRIEDFYVDLRERGDDDDAPVPVTARKLEGLVRLAESSARARLSQTVEKRDAERAVDLVEKSLEDTILTEEGEFDADIIESGTSKSQRDRIKGIKQLIASMEEEYDDGVPIEEVREEAEAVDGIDTDSFDATIDRLKSSGELYKPDADHIRTT